MKHLTILTLLCAAAISATAQEKLPDFPNPETDLVQEMKAKGVQRKAPLMLDRIQEEELVGEEATIQHVAPRVIERKQGATVTEDAPAAKAGYLNPEGTLFLGMDEAGKGAWMKRGGVIGAWSDTIDCWKWRNTTTGAYRKVTYGTSLSYEYPSWVDGACYSVDKDGNFCDTIMASGGYDESFAMGVNGDEEFLWQMAVPLQTVTREDGKTEKFMLLSNSLMPDEEDCGYAAGGLPSGRTVDGLWPLTNAINISKQYGTSMELIASKDADEYCHYLFGSSSVNTDTITGIDGTTYTRTAPVKLITRYDKPQAPLYIKSVTMAVGAEKFNAFHKDELKINGLHLEIQDMDGKVLAETDADRSHCSNMSYKIGQILTFSFKDTTDYGEILHEGLTVAEPFQVVVTGFSEGDEFGIYAARCTSYASKTEMEYADGKSRVVDYEPYIMLNGIFNTLENYFDLKAYEELGYETGTHGDTIDINMLSVSSPYYKYIAHWNAEPLSGASYFAFYSTFAPYDSISRYWTMEVERPEYIQIGADYDTNIGPEDDPVTFWDYLRAFQMFIYATDTPVLGDIIKVGKCGKYAYFHIVAVDGATAINEITARERRANAVKVEKNGRIGILRDGKLYNMLGGILR